ncbi:hypothetical protein CHS0354_042399 [Potamilus streckersoni]|uniref:Uncharacterized protein n=1 Tax=Potamilus streckersoni TaxID=2493646 RepID=A0AAE0SU16_9BIVA|nr:hypothetical protein CHS0354_042399 [Potamilus streckersoni]
MHNKPGTHIMHNSQEAGRSDNTAHHPNYQHNKPPHGELSKAKRETSNNKPTNLQTNGGNAKQEYNNQITDTKTSNRPTELQKPPKPKSYHYQHLHIDTKTGSPPDTKANHRKQAQIIDDNSTMELQKPLHNSPKNS